jgi:hypothetical protein
MVRIPRPRYYMIPDSDEKFPSIAAAERALDRRERIKALSPDPGYCTCGRHKSDQCDFCKQYIEGHGE